jgi:hypothetical protein
MSGPGTLPPEPSGPSPGHSRQLFFAARPEGEPTPSVFGVRELPLPEPGPGQLLCRNLCLSVDPYLRLKMHPRESYTPPLQIGEAIPGRSIAQVVASRAPGWRAGDLLMASGGWQDFVALDAGAVQRVDTTVAGIADWLGPLGMTGMTAYAGLKEIGRPQPGETLVVSAAAGAVGSLVGQIAKALGCHVVGIAGSQAKCDFVTAELGFDACVDYKAQGWQERLRAACPRGVDIYFDNVGGAVSAGVWPLLNPFARVPLCGLISQYNGQHAAPPHALDEWMRWMLVRRLTVRGFIVTDLAGTCPEFTERMAQWLQEGRVRTRTQLHHGFENTVPAFLGMLRGDNLGKTLVQIAWPANDLPSPHSP